MKFSQSAGQVNLDPTIAGGDLIATVADQCRPAYGIYRSLLRTNLLPLAAQFVENFKRSTEVRGVDRRWVLNGVAGLV